MNGLERIVAAVKHQPVDRTPVLPVLLMQGARALGLGLEEYFKTPVRLADGQLHLLETFGHDGVFAMPHVVQDVLPWGADIAFHADGPPSLSKMAFRTIEDLVAAPVPDPTAHPYLRRTLDAATALKREVGGDKLVVGAVIGPFSLPTMLVGTKHFLSLLLEDPARYRSWYPRLIDRMLQYTSAWAKAQFEAGCDLVVFAEGIASATIVDEAIFLRDARPALSEFTRRTSGLLALEWVGYGLPFTHHVADLPLAAVLAGSDDRLPAMRRALGPRKAIIGNLNNIQLLRWGAERVEFEARRAIRSAGPGFILSNQGPEVPFGVPDDAIAALVTAAHAVKPEAAIPAHARAA